MGPGGGERMTAVVKPGRLAGHVRAVSSKSCAHRALICSALSDRETELTVDDTNRDIDATACCLTALGADVTRHGNLWRVKPIRPVAKAVLDCGESGSTLRFLMPLAAAFGVDATFTGSGRLPDRPHTPLCDAIRRHGATVDSDRLPMRVTGRLRGGIFTMPGAISSQYVSALLFALPILPDSSRIDLTSRLESESYAALTENAVRRFGIKVERQGLTCAIPGGQKYVSPGSLRVEGDWSAAAFFLAANRLGSSVVIDGLDDRSAQGDRAVIALLDSIRGENRVIDAADVPDLVPALAAAASAVPGRTEIVGAARLRYKECDRLSAMTAGLRAMGTDIRETNDGLIIVGGALRGARVSGCGDHRIVMALAVAALSADGETTITDAEAVEKSYPGFWRDFRSLGGDDIVKFTGE